MATYNICSTYLIYQVRLSNASIPADQNSDGFQRVVNNRFRVFPEDFVLIDYGFASESQEATDETPASRSRVYWMVAVVYLVCGGVDECPLSTFKC